MALIKWSDCIAPPNDKPDLWTDAWEDVWSAKNDFGNVDVGARVEQLEKEVAELRVQIQELSSIVRETQYAQPVPIEQSVLAQWIHILSPPNNERMTE